MFLTRTSECYSTTHNSCRWVRIKGSKVLNRLVYYITLKLSSKTPINLDKMKLQTIFDSRLFEQIITNTSSTDLFFFLERNGLRKNMGQRGMEQKINTNVSCFANCFITTTNEYSESPVQNTKVQDQGVPLGKAEDFSLWYLEFRLQSLFLDGSLGVQHSPCF